MHVNTITWIAYSVLHVNALIVGFGYVLAVLIVAAQWGLIESLVTSVAATLCLNYFFLPPILSLTIADPQNWVALSVFLVTSITASRLSSGIRQKAAEASARRVEVERLYQLSLSLMLMDPAKALGPQIAERVQRQLDLWATAYFDGLTGTLYVAGAEDQRLDSSTLQAIATGQGSWFVWRKETRPAGSEIMIAPVALGGRVFGSLGIIGYSLSEPALQAIAYLAAIAIDHARQQLAAGRIEVARQSERLKSILLDALAHDFITPLTSIKIAITAVRSQYDHNAKEDDFLAVVEEEVDRFTQ